MRKVLIAFACVAALSGCDKLGLGKKGADGGTTGASGGGGLLSFLDKSFEGDITMMLKNAKSPAKTFTMELKSPKFRVDAGPELAPENPMMAQGVALILDPPAKKAYALITAKKQAVVIDLDKAKGMKLPTMGPGGRPSAPSAPSTPPEPPKIEDTGKKDTVAGYTCEVWKITEKDGKHSEACLAEGIKWIDLTDLGMQSPELAAAAAISGMNHFPLRVVSYDAANVEQTRMEAQKIEKKSLDDSRFAVPPDYQVIDLQQMMGAMMGGMGSARPGMPPGMPPHGLPPGFAPPGIHPGGR